MTTPQPLTLDWLIATGQEVTAEKLEAVKQAGKYEHREKIPETYLWMADLYNELTGQLPTKRVLLDWLQTFEEWKQERLEADHIRLAWQQASDINKGFPVGRPGALTTTAVSMRSKTIKAPAALQINTAGIEATRKEMDEKWSGVFVPRPANCPPPKFKKGQDPT